MSLNMFVSFLFTQEIFWNEISHIAQNRKQNLTELEPPFVYSSFEFLTKSIYNISIHHCMADSVNAILE